MSAEPLLWTLLLLGVGGLLMVLPFWPAWAEWRRPLDREALVVNTQPLTGTRLLTLRLPAGARFESLQADKIVLGEGGTAPISPTAEFERWQPPPRARPWGLQGWQIPHDLTIPAGQWVPCSLVVRGRLNVEGPGRLEGDIKTRGPMRIGAGCRVQGNLFSEGDIRLETGCQVSGVVMAEGRLLLAPHVVIGQPRSPVSVCADVIDAQGPVLVHGSVQARIQGHVQGAPALPPPVA